MNQIIKQVIRVGNSAGVLVPKEWINGKAKIELVTKPIDIKKDIFEILEPYLENVIGIYLVGSYARGEETERSDIDVLVISNKISKGIKRGKYDFLMISKNEVENALENNALPLIPMLMESKTLINNELIEKYKKEIKLSKKNLNWHLSLIKSAISLNKASINVDKEIGLKKCSDAVSYSLILNLRSLYVIGCIEKRQKWNTKGFISLIKKISGTMEAYEGYLRIKNNETPEERLPIEEAEKLINYISKELMKNKKWLKTRKE